jgi:hypothetical protein
LREARDVLVQRFDLLPASSQEYLLTMHWEELRDPVLIPSLKKLLAATGTTTQPLHDREMFQLLDMAPDEARPYVIAEIRDPDSTMNVENLGKLKDKSLPEVDAALLEQIRKLTQSTKNSDMALLGAKTELAARFATENIYRELLQLYQNMGADQSYYARGTLLAYFAKHNEREAMPLIEQAVADLKPGEYPAVLSDLTCLYYSEAIGALLTKLMNSDDPVSAGHAAHLIGVYGSAGDEKLLEARLKSWREQWSTRVAEADVQQQGQFERELINALIQGNSWKPSPERVRELQLSCVTALCKQSNVVRQ